eukprot:3205347-Pyramimonas_sp.AAC.1
MFRNTFLAVLAGADDDKDGVPLTEEQKQERALRAMGEGGGGVARRQGRLRRPGAVVEAAQLWGHDPRDGCAAMARGRHANPATGAF